jgi:hypothetical protein
MKFSKGKRHNPCATGQCWPSTRLSVTAKASSSAEATNEGQSRLRTLDDAAQIRPRVAYLSYLYGQHITLLQPISTRSLILD